MNADVIKISDKGMAVTHYNPKNRVRYGPGNRVCHLSEWCVSDSAMFDELIRK